MEWLLVAFISYNNAEHFEYTRFNTEASCKQTKTFIEKHSITSICIKDKQIKTKIKGIPCLENYSKKQNVK